MMSSPPSILYLIVSQESVNFNLPVFQIDHYTRIYTEELVTDATEILTAGSFDRVGRRER